MATEPRSEFHLPRKPLSAIDVENRRACATGSMRYAALTENADYNGHALRVDWNDYRGYYVCEYFWAGRVVIARGDCEYVLREAVKEFARQGRGASLHVAVKPEHAAVAEELGLLPGIGFTCVGSMMTIPEAVVDIKVPA